MRTVKISVSLFVVLVMFLVASLKLALAAGGEEWPKKPIEIYYGYLPGGAAEMLIRLYTPVMNKELGVPIVAVSKPGAGGALCTEFVANAKPDGYTIQEQSFGILVSRPYTHHTTATPRDFTYILGHTDFNYAFLVRKDAPWKDFREWVEYARRNPSTKVGTWGAYSSAQIVMEWICKREKIKVLQAPFQGEPDGFAALMGGHIDIMAGANMHPSLIEAGKLRTLLQLSGDPVDTAKVQYLTEIYPDYPQALKILLEAPTGLFGPKGMPAPIVQKIAKALRKGIDDDGFKRYVKRQGRRRIVWEGEEVLPKLMIADDGFPAFLKEIGFVKK